jgi:hypothetical protein
LDRNRRLKRTMKVDSTITAVEAATGGGSAPIMAALAAGYRLKRSSMPCRRKA